MPERPSGQPRGDQRWATFLRNPAWSILACDFFVAVTATFQLLYVFVVIEHGRRRLAHVNVTKHPTADWTLQQMREVVGGENTHRYLIHDRDSIFARHLDKSILALGLKVLRTPFRTPTANSICERMIGTIRRECLDWVISVSEKHLRATLREWVTHYNAGRPHKMLGPGVPGPPAVALVVPKPESRHRLPAGAIVHAKSVLGGLHHEYSLAPDGHLIVMELKEHLQAANICAPQLSPCCSLNVPTENLDTTAQPKLVTNSYRLVTVPETTRPVTPTWECPLRSKPQAPCHGSSSTT